MRSMSCILGDTANQHPQELIHFNMDQLSSSQAWKDGRRTKWFSFRLNRAFTGKYTTWGRTSERRLTRKVGYLEMEKTGLLMGCLMLEERKSSENQNGKGTSLILVV